MRSIKVSLFGPSDALQSQFIERFVYNRYNDPYDRTIQDAYFKNFEDNGNLIRMEILETQIFEDFEATMFNFARSSDGIILIYSIENWESYQSILHYHNKILQATEGEKKPMILCGNFCDRLNTRRVTYEEGMALANQIGCPFFETSPLNNINVSESFECIKDLIIKREEDVTIVNHQSIRQKDFCRV